MRFETRDTDDRPAPEVHFVADIVKLGAKTGALTVKVAEGRAIDLKIKYASVLKGYQAGDKVAGAFQQVLAIGDVGPAPAQADRRYWPRFPPGGDSP